MTNLTCLCDGNGTYIAEIPLSDAVVLQEMPCPLHAPQPPRERLLVRDLTRSGLVGEVMDYRSTADGERVDLRPPGGGLEWIADPNDLEEVPRTNHGEYECRGCRTLADDEIVRDVYGCDAGRHCTQATPQQRIAFEDLIAGRIAARLNTTDAR